MTKKYGFLFLKGMAMGAADVVPGVSGGTIAFITNIYETLIHALSQFDVRAVQLLLGHTKLESTVRYLGIEVDDALEMAERTEV